MYYPPFLRNSIVVSFGYAVGIRQGTLVNRCLILSLAPQIYHTNSKSHRTLYPVFRGAYSVRVDVWFDRILV